MDSEGNLVEIYEIEGQKGLFTIVFTDFPEGSGDGHEWEKLVVDTLKREKIGISTVEFDCESDMLCAYSKKEEHLKTIAKIIENLCGELYPEDESDEREPKSDLTISRNDFEYCIRCERSANCRSWHYQKVIPTIIGDFTLDIDFDSEKKPIKDKDLLKVQDTIEILMLQQEELLDVIYLYYKEAIENPEIFESCNAPRNLSPKELPPYIGNRLSVTVWGGCIDSSPYFKCIRPDWDPDWKTEKNIDYENGKFSFKEWE